MGNMFRCTLASGGALILTVTCDSAFAGQTITCADGTTTLTQTCPSSSPYTVEFKIPNSGTWIISSGTASISIVIPDTADLHNIPTGSTATPTGSIQTWLHCANIWDKSYTTISQVLSDFSTVTALIASNNAVDYMARSTTWASAVCSDNSAMVVIGANDYCANKLLANSTWLNAICNSTYLESVLNVKVPTMTSDTTPSGQVVYSSQLVTSYYSGYMAFDGTNGRWISTQGNNNPYDGYNFGISTLVKKATIRLYDKHGSPSTTVKIVAKNNASDAWTGISGNINLSSHIGEDYPVILENNSGYKYWGIQFVGKMYIDDSNFISVQKLQFYGRNAS